MAGLPCYAHVECACGHHALVGLTRFVHRDEMLRRARCTVCGKRGAVGMTVHVIASGSGRMEDQLARVAHVRVIEV